MSGGPERSSSEAVLELISGTRPEPFTAAEIASETEYSPRTIQNELQGFAERGLLQTKDIEGGDRVWWLSRQDREDDERVESGGAPTDAANDEKPQPSRQRLMKQHRQLARLVTQLNISDDLDELLRLITEEARDLVGAHQSVTSRTVNQNWEQAINAVSLSDKYADYRDYDTEPDGSGIYALVCERNQPMRMTQTELEAHSAWNAFGDEADEHPPMRGWLAVPIVGPEGKNMGLIQLSDKYEGEFTQADEAVLTQLANVASAAIENARLYDELRESEERYRTLFDSMTEGYCVVEQIDTAPGEPIDFRYLEANPAFRSFVGFQEIVGKTIREVVPGDPQEWLDVYERVAHAVDTVSFECELEPDGRVLQCHAFPIGDASNWQVGMTVQDITKRVERERRLKASNQRLESFASMLAHELRNPVAIGQIYSQQLPEETDSEVVEYVTDAFDRIEDMVDVMLVLTQEGSAIDESEELSLAETAREAWDEIETVEATLDVDIDTRIDAKETYIRHLFRNLFENAIQHGGRDVTVRIGSMEDGFFVADDGVGIPPDNRDEIFEAGVTTADGNGGTGLGLAFIKELADVYGWSCAVTESTAGGARFEFAGVTRNPSE